MADEVNLQNPKIMLKEVDNAIISVLSGGQSYKIGSRTLTRADLNMLYKMRNDLQTQIESNKSSNLFGNTFVSEFEGR